ncbi:glycosyltransferase family 39 protein [Candidatus Pacearchaeota archaeon]|nr:glycosyltransferase family 39 protein [Candidatus Pacearchaeota archaeon]
MAETDSFVDKLIEKLFDKKFRFLIAIAIIGLVLRIIAAINTGMFADDTVFATHAINFLNSGKLETYHQSASLWFLITDIFYKILGTTQLASRVCSILFGTLSILAIYLLSREFFDEKISLISSFLLAISAFAIKNMMAEMDSMAVFFIIFGMYFFVCALKKEKKSLFALSGIIFGLGIITKIYVFFFMPPLILYALYYNWKKDYVSVNKRFLRNYRIFIIIAILSLIIFIGYYFFKLSGEAGLTMVNILRICIINSIFITIAISILSVIFWYFLFVNRNLLKKIAIFLIIAGIFFLPAIIHNYLLYQERGILDFQFTRVFHYGEETAAQYYSWDAGWKAKPDYLGFFIGNSKQLPWSKMPSSLYALTYILYNDFIVFILGAIGMIFIFKKSRNYFWFFILSFGIPFFYLASIILLSKHYLFVLLLLVPAAAFSLDKILGKIQEKIKIRRIYLLAFLIVFSLIFLGYQSPYISSHFYGKSAIAQMINYKNNIEDGSLVVVDSRIYRGTLTWIFNDKHYIESAQFPLLIQEQNKLEGRTTIPVYYIECIKDDCGWGTIANQPDFNKSMEDITAYFKNISQEKATIKNIEQNKFYLLSGNGEDYYKVYKTAMNLAPQTLAMADSTHTFFLYPVGYNGASFDDISESNLLYKTARAIQYLAILLAFLSAIILLYILINKKD